MNTPTLESIIHDASEREPGDLLIALADYFYCLGAGIIPPPPAEPGRADLFATLECIHRVEVLQPREREGDPRLLRDARMGWLLSLPCQATRTELLRTED